MISERLLKFYQALDRNPGLISDTASFLDDFRQAADGKIREQLEKLITGRQEKTREISENSLFMYEVDDVVCSVRKLQEHASDMIFMVPRKLALVVLTGRLCVKEFRIVSSVGEFDCDQFDEHSTVKLLSEREYFEGEIYIRHDPYIISDVTGEGLAVSLYVGLFGRVDWSFDRSGSAVGATASDPRDTDIEALLLATEKIAPAISEKAILSLLEHQSFFVRWAALKALNSVAPDDVPAALEALAADPHKEIAMLSKSLLEG